MSARLSSIAMAHALFVSDLQPSQTLSSYRIRAAVTAVIRRHRTVAACAALTAQEFGEHPEAAAARMRWALATARATGPWLRRIAPPYPRHQRRVHAGRPALRDRARNHASLG